MASGHVVGEETSAALPDDQQLREDTSCALEEEVEEEVEDVSPKGQAVVGANFADFESSAAAAAAEIDGGGGAGDGKEGQGVVV